MPQLKVGCKRDTHPCAGRQHLLLNLLPLDLHVLGLPLAFILSQDQTLHCKNLFLKSLYKNQSRELNSKILTSYFDEIFHISPGCYFIISKNRWPPLPSHWRSTFCFWDDKVNISSLLSQTKMRYFSRPFPFPAFLIFKSRNIISFTLQSTLCL